MLFIILEKENFEWKRNKGIPQTIQRGGKHFLKLMENEDHTFLITKHLIPKMSVIVKQIKDFVECF